MISFLRLSKLYNSYLVIKKGAVVNTASIFLYPLSAQLLVTSVRSARTEVRSARTDVSKRQNNWITENRCYILQQPL